MVRQRVMSSSIAAIGYAAESAVLEVEFTNGGVYQYLGVDPEEHLALLESASKGRHVVRFIKGRFPCVQVSARSGS